MDNPVENLMLTGLPLPLQEILTAADFAFAARNASGLPYLPPRSIADGHC